MMHIVPPHSLRVHLVIIHPLEHTKVINTVGIKTPIHQFRKDDDIKMHLKSHDTRLWMPRNSPSWMKLKEGPKYFTRLAQAI